MLNNYDFTVIVWHSVHNGRACVEHIAKRNVAQHGTQRNVKRLANETKQTEYAEIVNKCKTQRQRERERASSL